MIDFSNTSKWATTISITSGKGGVGKTTFALKLAQDLAYFRKKVLLIDCDYNLSNTLVKLGLPLNNNFFQYIKKELPFNDCLYKKDHFHLLAGCNGNIDLFNQEIEIDRIILKIVYEQAQHYDFIILDGPSGIDPRIIKINAFTDDRIYILNPDASSVTDSYSLIKLLHNKYGIENNYLVYNKIPTPKHFAKISEAFDQTLLKYLGIKCTNLGSICENSNKLLSFDDQLFKNNQKDKKNIMVKNFSKVIEKYAETKGVTFKLNQNVQALQF